MQAMAEIENNALKVTEARQLIERDIGPLVKEVQRTLQAMGRDELFATSSSSQYQAPNDSMNHSRNYNNNNNSDMDSLIQSSEDLLRESQSILIETEYIGNQTLHQMGRQRDQLQNADDSLAAVQNAAATAARTLKKMSLRACRSRLALHVMIVLLIAANFLALYHVYKKHHRSSSTPPPGTL